MAVTVVGIPTVGAAESTNATSHTIILPTGISAGDTIIVSVALASSTTVTASGGPWSAASANQILDTSRSGVGGHVWVAVAAGTESGATVTFTTGTSLKIAAAATVLRGLDATTPVTSATDLTGVSATTQTGPSVTQDTTHIAFETVHLGTAANAVATYTPPSSMTLAASRSTGGTTGRAGVAQAYNLTPNTAVGSAWTTDVAGAWVAATLFLKIATVSPDAIVQGTAAGAAAGAASGVVATTWSRAQDTLSTDAPTVVTALGSSTPIVGATLIAPEDAAIVKRGAAAFVRGVSFPDTTTIQPSSRYSYSYGSPTCWAFETVVTGTKLAFLFKWLTGTNQGRWRLTVDGKRVTDGFQTLAGTTGGSMHTTLLTWASPATRRVLIEFNGVPFGGVFTDGAIAAVSAYSNRAIFQGDSITQGSDYNNAAGAGTWFARFAKYMGYDDPWNEAIGSTGFTVDGSSIKLTDATRLADVTTYAQANGDVYVWAGGNDGSTSITSAATTYFAALLAALPSARIIVIGTWNPYWPVNAARAARDAELDAVALSLGLPFISPITGKVRTAAGTVLAVKQPIIASAADVAAYVNTTDNVHPTDVGHAQIANWMAEAMQLIGQNALIVASPAGATAEAASSAVTAVRNVAVTAAPAGATAGAPSASVTVVRNVSIIASPASSSAGSAGATVTVGQFVSVVAAPASASAGSAAATVTTTRSVSITAAPASAWAGASAASVLVVRNVAVTAVPASATAGAAQATVSVGSVVDVAITAVASGAFAGSAPAVVSTTRSVAIVASPPMSRALPGNATWSGDSDVGSAFFAGSVGRSRLVGAAGQSRWKGHT